VQRSGRGRPPRWRRWVLLGGIAALVTAVGASSQGQELAAAGSADDAELPWAAGTALTIPELSKGAPAGATTLAGAPAQQAGQAPPAPAEISGLAANGIPNVALNAYRVAAARMDSSSPSCGIDWSLLAGIGRIESNHGRYGGAVLGADGSSAPKILGPPLDGGQFAYIGDSDDGLYDNDTRYDRAMGPMQFIPTTWRSYAVDGDGNGTTDPFNINDAALAAANYLCAAGGDLRTDAGQRRAVLAYNHSDEYVAEVLALARAYASGIPVADLGPMFGNTTSPVPPPTGPYYAPAAPGPAIGAQDMTPASGATTGAQPQPAPAPSGGSAQPAQSGGGGTSGAAPAGSGGGGAAPPPSSSGSGRPAGPPPNPGTAPAQPAPAPVPSLPAVPVPAAPVPLPPPPPVPSVPVPVPVPPLIPGETCNALGGLLVDLPPCPR